MISVADALERLFALVEPPYAEEVPLIEAFGRVLLTPATSNRAQPPFDASAMDGYAVRAVDAPAGARLSVIGEAAAGRRYEGHVGPSEAVRIMTGAPLPNGADAVVIQEDVERTGDMIRIGDAAVPGHVRRAGSDFALGAQIAAPRLLSAADVALIAAFGLATVQVARRPVVAILSTGDELVMPGEVPGPDQIIASNAFGLHAMLRGAGAEPRLLPIAGDTLADLDAAFALAAGADLILTIGGASVGDHDLIVPAAEARGADLAFHKVAMRPGKPLLAGRFANGPILIGLPGNPVSALVCATVFLLPVVRAMQGLAATPAPQSRVRLATALPIGGPRAHYMRARLQDDGAVLPFDRQDSSLLSVLSEATHLIVQAPRSAAVPAGDWADVIVV